MRKGTATRQRILDIAETAVLAKGFGATSIDELICEAGITKSGFFYHFKDKNDLALGLLERHEQQSEILLSGVFGRARELSDDPLQVFLLGLTLLAERLTEMPAGHPGCIVASLSYQDRLFDRNVRAAVNSNMAGWSSHFRAMLGEIAQAYPPRLPVNLDHVARMVCCLIDGGIVMSKGLGMPDVLPEQLLMARNHIRLLFQPWPTRRPGQRPVAE
ncbi:MAG TPA: TetR/AcrR family transcriptional regulator [Devosia sp.]|nr:TetR/AcrR family transcriptional regulator [Devosia sp.]